MGEGGGGRWEGAAREAAREGRGLLLLLSLPGNSVGSAFQLHRPAPGSRTSEAGQRVRRPGAADGLDATKAQILGAGPIMAPAMEV